MRETCILLKIEFRRLFRSKLFYICLVIGLAIAAASYVNKTLLHTDVLNGFTGDPASYPFSVYNSWMGNYVGTETFATAYVYVCMLLAALPYCAFFAIDNKNQYILQFYSRVSKRKVHFARFVTTFVSGGMLVVIPVIANLLATMMFIPMLNPVENGLFMGGGKCIMGNLFYDHPMIYVMIYVVQFFVYGGAFSVVSLAISYVFDNAFLVVISPFVVYYGIGVLSTVVKNILGVHTFNPTVYLSPSYLLGDDGLIGFVLEPLLLIIISALVFFKKGDKNEAL